MSSTLKGFFITGTDTNVGKTYIACLLAKHLLADGYTPIPRKPVESGCRLTDGELIPADALALQQACNSQEPLGKICPYPLSTAISPAEAARLENSRISIDDLYLACTDISQETQSQPDSLLIVEGAGGFYSPLCENGLNADLAEKLALPVILVAEDRLGCINHILLSIEAIKARKLKLLAVILNEITATNLPLNNADELSRLTDVTIFQANAHTLPLLAKHLLSTL